MQIVGSMSRNAHVTIGIRSTKIGNNKQHLIAALSHKGVDAVGYLPVHIHEVKRETARHSLFLRSKAHDGLIIGMQSFLLGCEHVLVHEGMIERVDVPIVEDGCSSVTPAEALCVHTTLAIFLSCINHQRVVAHESQTKHGSHPLSCICSKEIACYALLVVVLKKIEHVVIDVVHALPSVGNGCRWPSCTHDVAHGVIHAHLVVEIVEASANVSAIQRWVIDLSNEQDIWILSLHLCCGIAPKCVWHHLCHVTSESIDTLGSPEEQNVGHLLPCVGHRREMFRTAA